MLKVAVGQCEGGEPEAVAASVIEACRRQLDGAAPQAGILYMAASFDPAPIVRAVAAAFPGVALIGGTTAGDLSSALGFSEDSVTLTLFAGDALRFTAGVGEGLAGDPAGAVRAALANAGPEPVLCLALLDPAAGTSELAVRALTEALPGTAILGGALGSPWNTNLRASVFFGERVLRDAIVLLCFHGRARCALQIHNGWRPVGPRQTVTAGVGRVVERIGERTAVGFHQHYLGEHLRPAFEFPLAVFAEDDERFYLRVPRTYDASDGTVMYSGDVPVGSQVQLTEYVRSDAITGTEAAVAGAVRALGEPPAFALVFSCASRKLVFGTQIACEDAILRERLQGAPYVGFYAFGEVAPLRQGGPAYYHNSTMITAVIAVDGPKDRPVQTCTPTGCPAPTDARSLAAKLRRSESYRARLEDSKEQQTAMLRTIGAEIEAARRRIAAQNEELVRLNAELIREQEKSEALLLNILPRDVAEELKRVGRVDPVFYPSASVLFTDFQDFTRIAASISPAELIRELDFYFTAFDAIIERHGLEKLKTIGDAYMCAGGLPTPSRTHGLDAVTAAWEIQAFMREVVAAKTAAGEPCWRLRIGIHTGPLMAGVIGHKKFAYDIWGDTVNLASRLESTGEAGRVNISATTHALVKDAFLCEHRGKIRAKNAAELDMFFVVGPRALA